MAVEIVSDPGEIEGFLLPQSVAADPILGAPAPYEADPDPFAPQEPDLTTPQGAAQAADDRVAALQAQVAGLLQNQEQNLHQQRVAQRSAEIADLTRQIREKAELGLFGDIEALQVRLTQLAAAPVPAPNAGATVTQNGQTAVIPWTSNFQQDVNDWKAKQSWIGVDGIRTQAMLQVGNVIDARKFATREQYFAAVDRFIERAAKPHSDLDIPSPTVRGGTGGGGATPKPQPGGFKEFTSLSQLPARDRQIAALYVGTNGMTQEKYLESYNNTRKDAARNAARARR